MVVVVNSNSADSLQLGNYYCEKRQVPSQNVLRINWTGGNIEWSLDDYQNALVNPLLAMLADRQLTNQIDYIVLSMDIPYRVTTETNGVNSTTSALFYGFMPDFRDPYTCPLASGSASAYAGSEGIFRQTPPISAASNSFLVTMITSSNLALAMQIVDSGVLADGSFPTQTVFLAKTSDTARNVRFVLFDNAVFNARMRGNCSIQRTNIDGTTNLGNLMGLQTGLDVFSLSGTTFATGAMADDLTSYGGMLFESTGQTSLLPFLQAGTAGSYGTIVEPCNYLEKFPSPQNYFFQLRGFNLAECYYQSVTNPYEGLIVGEPLSAPFAQPCDGLWNNLPPSSSLTGSTNLSVQFTAADATRPVQQVDLFLDGTFLQTLTNISPAEGNALYVTLPGCTNLSYPVLAGDTIASVASGLADVLNSISNLIVTGVDALVHGDRIELQSADPDRTGDQTFLSVSNAIGPASALTTFIQAGRSNFLDSIAWGVRGIDIAGTVVSNDFLTLNVTKTNGANVTVSVTNYSDGVTLSQFVQQFMDAINATNSLQGGDGLAAEDLTGGNAGGVDFNLRALSRGFAAAQIQASVAGDFVITPATAQKLDGNLSDLRPRNYLYITAGVTNLALNFLFDTTTQADGYHELTAVAYEGSHVRTQKRVSRCVLIQNTTLSATLSCLPDSTNIAVEAAMQFSVVANTNTVTQIELFSTGGSLGVVTNQSSAIFSVAGTNLGAGLHPFYALVTRADGKQYRTQTKWIRIIGSEPLFSLTILGAAPTLSWPATAGRLYEIVSATNVADTFQLRDSLITTNSLALWSETNHSSPQRFYRVSALQ